MRAAPFLLLALMLLSGCPKPKPSLYFTEASNSFATLTGRLGDDAYFDDEMAKIEELLKKVPEDSLDSLEAKRLLAHITAERKRVIADKAAHDKALAAALKPTAPSGSSGSSFPEPVAEVDAGNPRALKIGMTTDEVTKVSGDCFAFKDQVRLFHPDGTEGQGRAWLMSADATCHTLYRELEGKALVFEQDKLMQFVAESAIRHETADGGAGSAPKGVPAPAPTPGANPPPPADDTTKPPPMENIGPGQLEPTPQQ